MSARASQPDAPEVMVRIGEPPVEPALQAADRMGGDLRSRLFGAAAIVIGAFVLSRLTGLLRTVAISYRFGTGPELDAYLAANRISDTMFQVLVGGAVSSAFIPVLSSYLSRRDHSGAWRTVSGLFTLSVAGLAPLCLLLAVFALPVMQAWTAFEPRYEELAANLLRIQLIAPLFFALGTFATSVLNAHQRFLLAALAPTAYNCGIILGALVLALPLGIYGLAIGAVFGAALYLLVQVPGLAVVGMRYRPTFSLNDPGVRQVGRLMLPRTLGLAVAQLNFLVIVALASSVPGAITALEYAWILMMLPLGVFAMAISTAVFPTLAEQVAAGRPEEMRATLSTALRTILYLTVPAAVGLVVLGEPIVRLLLERGEFGPESTALTVVALRFYALGLVGLAMVEIVTRAFYALHDTRTPVLIAGAAMVVNLALALLLRVPLGHGGLALALSIASLAEAALLLGLARRRLGGLHDRRLGSAAARDLIGSAALAAALLLLVPWLHGWIDASALTGQIALVGSSVAAGGIVYLAVTSLIGAEEPVRLLSLARRRMG